MWSKIVKALEPFVPQLIKQFAVKFVMGVIGITGGFYAWIVGFVLNKAWTEADKEIESGARLADQTSTDKEIDKKYQGDIKNGAPEEELIKDETDILNGGRPKH